MSNSKFTPNTPEWEEMRKEKIGASDAPVIMGISPYETPYELWERKLSLRENKKTTFSMERGHILEPEARSTVELRLGMSLPPSVKFHKEKEWMLATLDGLSEDNKTLVEIKCPGSDDHRTALTGNIPEKYYPQLQHQLEVCELEKGFYFSFDGKEGVLLEFYRDDKYIKKLIVLEEEFYKCMQDLTPPPLTERDYRLMETPEWKEAAIEWKRIYAQLSSLEQEEKKLRERLIFMCQNQSSMGGGIRVGKNFRKGSIDYGRIPELSGIDLERYRKKSTEYWRIMEAKG